MLTAGMMRTLVLLHEFAFATYRGALHERRRSPPSTNHARAAGAAEPAKGGRRYVGHRADEGNARQRDLDLGPTGL